MIAELIRLETNRDYGTLGVLRLNKKVVCCTLEPSQYGNKTSISSIPTGQYQCKRYSSQKYKSTFQVMNVTDRGAILFHAGNTIDDTAGCIILGKHFGKLNKTARAILNSGKTFEKFMEILIDHEEFHLTVSEMY